MHLYKTMKNFLLDQDYYIDIFQDFIHVFNYIDILKLEETKVILDMPNFNLEIKGQDLVVKRLEKKEILIQGTIEGVNLKR